MNTANFSEYLQNPSLLYQITYEELKTLIVQYPYNQNLRYLISQKSNMENNSDYDNYLRSAAIISTDRPHLYHILKEQKVKILVTDNFILEEETLELKDLKELDLQKAELEPIEEVVPTPSFDLKTVEQPEEQETIFDTFPELSPDAISDEEALSFDKIEEKVTLPILEEEDSIAELISDTVTEENSIEQLINDTAAPTVVAGTATAASIAALLADDFEPKPIERKEKVVTEEVIEENVALESLFETEMPEIIEEEEVAVEVAEETPVVNFTPQVTSISQLLDSEELKEQRAKRIAIRPLHRRNFIKNKIQVLPAIEEVTIAAPVQTKETEEEEIYASVGGSADESTDIASETYASILIRQNQYQKAIQVYDRLKLIFPEKSAFFAEQIQSLEGKL